MILDKLTPAELMHTREAAKFLLSRLPGWFVPPVLRWLIASLTEEIQNRGIKELNIQIMFITIFEAEAPTMLTDLGNLPVIDCTVPDEDQSVSAFADFVNTLDIDDLDEVS